MSRSHDAPVPASVLERHRHVCVFYHSIDAEYRVLTPFIRAGFGTYDLSRFSAKSAIGVLRSHPVAIIGGVVHENPFDVPPDELLRELRERTDQAALTVA